MIDRQLELGFNGASGMRAANRGQRRHSRARWWFDRMHQVVASARDWRPTPPSPAQQSELVFSETKRL